MPPRTRNTPADVEKEPKIKWQKSRAKALLRRDILEGRVPLEGGRQTTMKLRQVYELRPEFAEYMYSKFSSRLSSLRTTISECNDRAARDQEAFDNFVANHPETSLFSHHGYIQWQGSEAQKLLKEDLENNLHETMEKKDLFRSRPEYYENFPLNVFRDKVYQEIRTAKYLHTTAVKGKDARRRVPRNR